MTKKALVVLADGFEEIEAIAPIDIMRRAGINVTVAGLSSREVTSARRVTVKADTVLHETEEVFDAVVFPGGTGGAENLSRSDTVKRLIRKMYGQGKIIAAICASPAYVLAGTGVLDGKSATCDPGTETKFPSSTRYSDEPVVVDGTIVTGKGAGSASDFGLTIVRLLCGKDAAETVKGEMLL
jgi:4-methyl-5(b-hydroxyethyl)-thiazole monophosphate biosynthesis